MLVTQEGFSNYKLLPRFATGTHKHPGLNLPINQQKSAWSRTLVRIQRFGLDFSAVFSIMYFIKFKAVRAK